MIGTIETTAEEDRTAHWPETVTKTVEAQLEARGEELRERFAELLDERR